MAALADVLGLTEGAALYAFFAVFLAGVVRGFSGFALSALAMASLVFVLPPVQIIVICLVLEATATVLMTRRGFGQADKRMVFGLILGVGIGAPIGLAITTSVTEETSRVVALGMILSLAAAQLSGARPAFLATRPGLLGSGAAAGVVQGAAASGGMVVALYALARQAPAAVMRDSLVFYLTLSIATNAVFYAIFGVMTVEILLKGAALALPAGVGVLVGARLFSPRLQPYYRPICLWILIGLAAFGLLQALL
ncbi:MAG: sulfite exporter TauE/SafE family protein [Pseudomonadota bacterium]